MLSTCLIEELICWPCHLHVPCALTSLVPLWQQRRIENTIYTATETSQKKRWWNCSGQSEIKCHQRITPCVTARSKGGPLVLNSFGWKNTRSAQAEPIVLQLFAPPPPPFSATSLNSAFVPAGSLTSRKPALGYFFLRLRIRGSRLFTLSSHGDPTSPCCTVRAARVAHGSFRHSPHSACWDCGPPECALGGSTKTGSSSSLLWRKNKHTNVFINSTLMGTT